MFYPTLQQPALVFSSCAVSEVNELHSMQSLKRTVATLSIHIHLSFTGT